MSRETILIALGVLVALSPYLGLPLSILGILLPLAGLAVISIGVTLRLRNREVPTVIAPSGPPIAKVPVYEAPEA